MQSSAARILITALIITALWWTKNCSASSARNTTNLISGKQLTLEDAEEDLPKLRSETEKEEKEEEEDEPTPFRERYRRLIPYMTYYVSNNYVNHAQSQSRLSGSTNFNNVRIPQQQQPQTPIRRRYQYSSSTRNYNNVPLNILSHNLNDIKNANKQNYYVSGPIQEKEKFIPSVQYDPKGMDNEEIFTPIIRTHSNQKLNFEDYQAQIYNRYKISRPIIGLTQSTTTRTPQVPGSSLLKPERPHHLLKHYTTIRPSTTKINFTPKYGDAILLREESIRTPNILKQEFTTTKYIERPPSNDEEQFKYNQGEEGGTRYFTQEYQPPRFVRPQIPQPFRPSNNKQSEYRSRPEKANVNLSHIVKSLQLSNQLPEMLNADNIDDSIKTLVEILRLLNNGGKNVAAFYDPQDVSTRVNSSPKYTGGDRNYQPVNTDTRQKIIHQAKKPALKISRPIFTQNDIQGANVNGIKSPELNNNGPYHVDITEVVGLREYASSPPTTSLTSKIPDIEQSERPDRIETTTKSNPYKISHEISEEEVTPITLTTTEEPALNYPPPDGASSHTQNFPPTSVKYGATRGKPNVDYPAYATIPKTEFSCTTQRYKGFFGDPDTGCQVWHYCDLNGGKSSFLCPNGTIFSQVALTCDWWFNVKCESTTQLYVLNERLYKYILPVMPKFPEDFSGPEVDRYLELKFKEMETKLKEKKLKKQQEELKKTKNPPQIQIDESSDSK